VPYARSFDGTLIHAEPLGSGRAVVLLPDHAPHLEEPEQFAHTLRRFPAETSQRATAR